MPPLLRSTILGLTLVLAPALHAQQGDPDAAVGIEHAKLDDAPVAATVHFGTGSAALTAPARQALDGFAAQLAADPASHVEIDGHTDNSGAERLNDRLSDQRAAAVRAYLASRGIPHERLTAVGYGAGQPVSPNDTEAGRAQNRRADLQIVQ